MAFRINRANKENQETKATVDRRAARFVIALLFIDKFVFNEGEPFF